MIMASRISGVKRRCPGGRKMFDFHKDQPDNAGMIQVIGTKKCSDTQKAIRFFKERRVQIQFVDVGERNLSAGEIKNIARSIPVEELIDRDGKEFAKRNLAYIRFDAAKVLEENSLLLKTPVVRSGNRAVLGHRPDDWKLMAEA